MLLLLLLLLLLQDGWYGTSAIKREYLAANVYFDRDTLVLDTNKAKQVTFSVSGGITGDRECRCHNYTALSTQCCREAT